MSVLLAACVLGGALQGCAGPSTFPSFDAPAGSDDELPPELSALIDEQSELGKPEARFVADFEGHDIYLVRGDGGTSCLGIADGNNSFFSCGGPDGRLTVDATSVGTFEVAPAPIGQIDGWTVLTENVRVKNR